MILNKKLKNIKVAIVYDRVNKWGGAERVLLVLHEMFPNADLFTSVYDRKTSSWSKVFPNVYTTFIQKIPFAKKYHELFAWLMPIAFETFDFTGYDLVISVTSEFAKGIVTKPGTYHICYCLTPTRYLWSGYHEYFKNPVLRFVSKPFVNYLRKWDKIAANRPDMTIAISTVVKSRIKKYYDINADTIFPPSEIKNLKLERNLKSLSGKTAKDDNYFLVVSRLVKYKRVDLVIKVFNQLGLPLIVIGTGWEYWRLKLLARRNIKFIRNVNDFKLVKYYKNAKAVIMPQFEDFGLVSVEAQSFGTPIIGYGHGGVSDTVIDGKTGVLFDNQNIASLMNAIAKFDKIGFNHSYIKSNAKRFTKEVFKKRIQEALVRINIGRGRGNTSLAKIS